jgi:hypothetical protein
VAGHLVRGCCPNDPFPPGNFDLASGVGTTLNKLAGDTTTTNSALDLRGNPGPTTPYCFQFGVNTAGYGILSLSFALQSIGNGGQFSQIGVMYSTNGGASLTATPEGLVAINRNGAYHIYTFDISGAVNTANAISKSV